MTSSDFIKWVYPQAQKLGEISPVFVTAQAALESGWGAKAIGNNLFGITKGSSWKGPVKLVTTTEYFLKPDKKFIAPEKVIAIKPVTVTVNGETKTRYRYLVERLFRDYASLSDCLEDYLKILKYNPLFSDAWCYRKDPDLFVDHLQDNIGAKYATAPNYVSVMKSLFRKVEREIQFL